MKLQPILIVTCSQVLLNIKVIETFGLSEQKNTGNCFPGLKIFAALSLKVEYKTYLPHTFNNKKLIRMTTSALVMWLTTTTIVTSLCVYFFYKVLTAKKKNEPDSYTDND